MKKLLNYKKIHFVGILGSSMRNLAKITEKFGILISGSDIDYNGESLGNFVVKKRFSPEELMGVDLVVYSSAVPENDFERKIAQELKIETASRAEFLGKLSQEFRKVIAVSGTHGKTTTSAMIGELLKFLDLSPALHIGGDYKNFFPFKKDYFVTEACEYKNSFLSLTPDISLILNVEYDHPDCFSSLKDVEKSFQAFAQNTKQDGFIISECGTDFGENKNNLHVFKDIKYEIIGENNGFFSFSPILFEEKLPDVHLKVRGIHNVKNACFALLAVFSLGLPVAPCCKALESFTGAERRYQKVVKNGCEFVVDYAHHPTEIKTAIAVARMDGKRVKVYFQPHTYSRTKALFDEFCEALSLADEVVIIKEFPARETPSCGKNAYELYLALRSTMHCSYVDYIPKDKIFKENTQNTTILVLGAGDIGEILI